MTPLNHLEYKDLRCEGGFTYKQGQIWVSQLDWALCSVSALPNVKEFTILQNFLLPTNHAPISVKLSGFMNAINNMIYRANSLGKTYSEINTNESIREVCHPLRPRSIDTAKFCENRVAADDLYQSVTRRLLSKVCHLQ